MSGISPWSCPGLLLRLLSSCCRSNQVLVSRSGQQSTAASSCMLVKAGVQCCKKCIVPWLPAMFQRAARRTVRPKCTRVSALSDILRPRRRAAMLAVP